MGAESLRVRGKVLMAEDLQIIRALITSKPRQGRTQLSRTLCERFGWRQPNGAWQDVACRGLLLKLEKCGVLQLPARQSAGGNPIKQTRRPPPVMMEETPVTGMLGSFPLCRLDPMTRPADSGRWNSLIERYHYLGYRPLVGRSLKYRILLGDQEVGVMGWCSPSWKLASRDNYIGWDAGTREKNLQGVANNTRFLIYPWVRVKNLASHVLSLAARRVPVDWRARYGGEVYLFETFVDPQRYRGTCYRAANWVYLGKSRGSSKRGDAYHYHGCKKDVYVYPVCDDFRERLSA